MGSWPRVVGGVAGVAVVAAVTSGCQGAPARSLKPPTLTVARLASRAVGGVVASGATGGRPWRIRLTLASDRSCSPRPGWAVDCAEPVGNALTQWQDWQEP